eukprot:Gb_27844 [translate_table: standard]
MDHGILPLSFYCRNARLCLKKAAFAKKCHVVADEVENLKTFEELVSESIPSHPLYPDIKGEKQVTELQSLLEAAKKRLAELQTKISKSFSPGKTKIDSHKPQKFSPSKTSAQKQSSKTRPTSPPKPQKKFDGKLEVLKQTNSDNSSKNTRDNIIQDSQLTQENHTECSKNVSLQSRKCQEKVQSRSNIYANPSSDKYCKRWSWPAEDDEIIRLPFKSSKVEKKDNCEVIISIPEKLHVNDWERVGRKRDFPPYFKVDEKRKQKNSIRHIQTIKEFFSDDSESGIEIDKRNSAEETNDGCAVSPTSLKMEENSLVIKSGGDDFYDLCESEGDVVREESQVRTGTGHPLASKLVRVSWKANILEEPDTISGGAGSGIPTMENPSKLCRPRGILKHRHQTSVSEGLGEFQSILEDGLGLWENEKRELEWSNRAADPLSSGESSDQKTPVASDRSWERTIEKHWQDSSQSSQMDADTKEERPKGKLYDSETESRKSISGGQINVDTGPTDHPKSGGNEVLDDMCELTQDVISDGIRRPAVNPRIISHGEKPVTESILLNREKTNVENPKRVKFLGCDEEEENDLPNFLDEISKHEHGSPFDSVLESIDTDNELPIVHNRHGGKLGLESEETNCPHTEFHEAPSLSHQSSAPTIFGPQVASSSLSHDLEEQQLDVEFKGGLFGLQAVSTKKPSSDTTIPDISNHSLEMRFYGEPQDFRGYERSAANLDGTTFSNPVFDFESSRSNQKFPDRDSILSSVVLLQNDEFSAPHEISQLQSKNGADFQMSQVLEVSREKNLPNVLANSQKLEVTAKKGHSFQLANNGNQIDLSEPGEEGNIIGCIVTPNNTFNRRIKEKISSDQSLTDDEEGTLKKLKTLKKDSNKIFPMQGEESLCHLATTDLDQRTKVTNLQKRMGGLQHMVEELKELVGRLSVKDKDEDEDVQYRLEGLEKEMKGLKDKTGLELFDMRKIIKDEIKGKLDQIKSDTKISRDTLESNLSECSGKLELFQMQMDYMLADAKALCINGIDGKLGKSAMALKSGLKNDVEQMELKMLNKLEEFKDLIHAKLEGLKEDCTAAEKDISCREACIEEKMENLFTNKFRTLLVTEIEVLTEAKLEKWFLNKFGNSGAMQSDILTEEKLEVWFLNKMGTLFTDKSTKEMKDEFCLIKAETEEKIHDQVELVAKIAETTMADVQKEKVFFKSESDVLKKMVETVRNEGMHLKLMSEDLKKGFAEEIEEYRQKIGRLTSDEIHLQNTIQGLKKLEEAHQMQRNESSTLDSAQEIALIIQKVENLSQLYLRVEEFKSNLFELKHSCNDRFQVLGDKYEELQRKQENESTTEAPPSESTLDGSENKLLQLKKQELLDCLEKERIKAENIVAIVKKDRDLAEISAADATASAHKAEEVLSKLYLSLNNEIASAREKNTQLQENLAMARDSIAAAALEAKRSSADLNKGREAAITALLEAQKSSLELRGEIEQERKNLKQLLSSIDQEKQSIDLAASQAVDVAAKAEALLSDITSSRSKTMQLEEGLSKTVAKAINCMQEEYIQEVEKAVAVLQRTTHLEVSKAKAVTEELKRKASIISSVNFERGEDRLVVHSEFEYFIQKSEAAISDLSKLIKEVKDAKETSRVSMSILSMEECIATKEKVDHLAERVKSIIMRIEGMTHCDSTPQKETENTETVVIKSEVNRLEKQIKQVTEEHRILGGKVMSTEKKLRKLDNRQADLSHSLEQYKDRICDLEKSTTTWHPRYEATSEVMRELKSRMIALESLPKLVGIPENLESNTMEMRETSENKRLPNLNNGTPRVTRRLDKVQYVGDTLRFNPIQITEGIATSGDTREIEPVTPSNTTSLHTLERRIEHVASATYTNLR